MISKYIPDAETLEIMKRREVEWSQTDARTGERKLRPYQSSAVEGVRQALRQGHKNVLVQASTGAGKTVTAADIISSATAKGNRVLFLADTLELVEQAVKTFDAWGLDVGVMQGDHYRTDESCMVQVCTPQTISARLKRQRANFEQYPVGLVLVDECYSDDTEVLTRNGFCLFGDIHEGEELAQYDPDTGELSWATPSRLICKDHDGEMVLIQNDNGVDLLVTPDHDVLQIRHGEKSWRKVKAKDAKFNHAWDFAHAGLIDGEKHCLSGMEAYAIAFQADGSFHGETNNDGTRTHAFSFSKQRKIDRFIELCSSAKLNWKEVRGDSRRRGGAAIRRRFMVYGISENFEKALAPHLDIRDMSTGCARQAINEVCLWDGYINPKAESQMSYSSTDRTNADVVQELCILAGYKSKMVCIEDSRSEKYSNIYKVNINAATAFTGSQKIVSQRQDYKGKVYCATVPKGNLVVRRNGKPVVCGNCHVVYRARDSLAELYPKAPFIGLSATPFTKGLGRFYTEVVEMIPMRELIDQGYLCDYTAFGPDVPDMAGVAMSGDDYSAEGAADVMSNRNLVGSILDTWKAHAENRKTIVFACNVAHSKALAKMFQGAGYSCEHVDGYPTSANAEERKAERFEVIERFRNGDTQILCNVAIATKGFDVPDIGCIVLARPTKSEMLLWQMLGRGLRTAEGKSDCIVLDHGGSLLRLGFPEDRTDFSLCDGSKKAAEKKAERRERLPTPCPACTFLKPAGVHRCPKCGFAPEPQHTVVNVDGELVPLKTAQAMEKPWSAGAKASKETKQSVYSELVRVCEDHGKKRGWVAHTYRDMFGIWPKGLDWSASGGGFSDLAREVEKFIRNKNARFKRQAAKQEVGV